MILLVFSLAIVLVLSIILTIISDENRILDILVIILNIIGLVLLFVIVNFL